MKKMMSLVILPISVALVFTGCAKREPLTADEKWDRFCLTYESAAYTMMSDRQHDVTLEKSIEHLHKLPEGIERNMLIEMVKEAHQTPKYDQQADKEKAMETFKTGRYQSCKAQQPAA